MRKEFLILILAILFLGCNHKTKNISDSNTIHILKNYPQKEITLQNIAKIEYIALETTDDILLSEQCRISYISDKYIMVWERKGDIFIFHRNGKILYHFNNKGLSNNEYFEIMSVVLDEKNEEIFVVDTYNLAKYRILVFSLTGKYKRTLNYSEEFHLRVYNFDDENLLVYDEKGLFDGSYNRNPYMFLSKKDGSIVATLDITLPVRLPYSLSGQINYNGQSVPLFQVIYPQYLAIKNGQDIVISDVSSDTIYILKNNKELLPILNFSPSVHSLAPFTKLYTNILTENFLVLEQRVIDFQSFDPLKGMPISLLIYEFENSLTSEVKFINNDFPNDSWKPHRINMSNKNMAAGLIQTPKLHDAYRKNQLKGELRKLVATLDEEDNPVIMIVKFY